jgi:agmatinase
MNKNNPTNTESPRKHDPSQTISAEFGVFGLPINESDARVVLLPVPWEVTTSYGVGASKGPKIIREASAQIDLFDFETGKSYEAGYYMREYSEDLKAKNDLFKAKAQELIKMKENLSEDWARQDQLTSEVNQACRETTDWVYQQTKEILAAGKLFGLVGGDHSTPLGAIRAIGEKFQGDYGILHIDAHADLRNAYHGFEQSHASIMFNVLKEKFAPKKLVQIGIRDFCEDEYELSKNDPRVKTFYDIGLKRQLLEGQSWAKICQEIIHELPQNIYISLDIDGLDPALCPGTGTPVAGGLSLDQVFYLFNTLVSSGRKVIAFDLNEVSPGSDEHSEWDGNVGARILYKLCGWLVKSNS